MQNVYAFEKRFHRIFRIGQRAEEPLVNMQKSEPLPRPSSKTSEQARPQAYTRPLGPSAKPACSTNTLGGRGGQIDEVKREHRDVSSTSTRTESQTPVDIYAPHVKTYMLFVYAFENEFQRLKHQCSVNIRLVKGLSESFNIPCS